MIPLLQRTRRIDDRFSSMSRHLVGKNVPYGKQRLQSYFRDTYSNAKSYVRFPRLYLSQDSGHKAFAREVCPLRALSTPLGLIEHLVWCPRRGSSALYWPSDLPFASVRIPQHNHTSSGTHHIEELRSSAVMYRFSFPMLHTIADHFPLILF